MATRGRPKLSHDEKCRRRSEQFWKYVQKTDGCWLWTGAKAAHGYGQFLSPDGQTRAHRWSYKIHRGIIPDGMYVCHSCDRPSCVNPDHLFLGTAHDNVRDMFRKGRNRPRGYYSKLERARSALENLS